MRCTCAPSAARPKPIWSTRSKASGFAELSLVAAEQGPSSGICCFSRLDAPVRALALAPAYRFPDGRGISARRWCARAWRGPPSGAGSRFVLGNPAYYGRFGFSPTAAAGEYECPYANLCLMAPATGARAEVALVYPAPFAAIGS